VPAVVGRDGIITIESWKLDPWEEEHFQAAGGFVTDLCRKLGV
jgi:hypothetical protein